MSGVVAVGAPTADRFVPALALLLASDAAWFATVARRLYPKRVLQPQGGVRLEYAPLAWASLAAGLSAARPHAVGPAALYGAAVGWLTYAVFNGTELAIRQDWRCGFTALADLLWGTALCSATCAVVQAARSDALTGVASVALAGEAVALAYLVARRRPAPAGRARIAPHRDGAGRPRAGRRGR